MASYLKGLPAVDVGQIMGFAPAVIEQGVFAAGVKNGDPVSYADGKFSKATGADIYGIAVNVAPARTECKEGDIGGVCVQGYVAVAVATGTPARGSKTCYVSASGEWAADTGTAFANAKWASDGVTEDKVGIIRIYN
jgi:hypothetical protein